MKTKEELYHKVCLTPRLPRVVLKPNSYGGLQDQQEQDARISGDLFSGSSSCRETWSNNVDYRTSGIPLSVVEKQDFNRKDKVKTLIQQFENHPNKESFLQDLKQTEKINKLSEKSQKLIADMNNTEIFELCEDLFQKAMSRLQFVLRNRHCSLYLVKMLKTVAKNQGVQQGRQRRLINSWLC